MEREHSRDPKQLCGLFGEQLYTGEFTVVKRKRILRKDPATNIMQPARGFLEPEKGEIHVLQDDKIDEQVITVLHELIHFHFPQTPEEEVETQGVELFNSLNHRQKNFFTMMVYLETLDS